MVDPEHRRPARCLALGDSEAFGFRPPLHQTYAGSRLGFAVRHLRHHPRTRPVGLGALRQRAHYRHRLVVVTYYPLDHRDPAASAATEALDDVVEQAAGARRARVADGFAAFRRASAAAGDDPCAAGLLIALPTGGCDEHPIRRGHRVLARAVALAAARG